MKLQGDFDQKSRGNTVLLDLTKGSFEMGLSLKDLIVLPQREPCFFCKYSSEPP